MRPAKPPSPVGWIAMVGCAPEASGGISTVIRSLLTSPLGQEWPLMVVATWVPGSPVKRDLAFGKAAAFLWWQAVSGGLQAVHMHMAARGSFWRKWLIGWLLAGRGVRVIVHVHDGSLPQWHGEQPPWVQRLFARFLGRADAVIVLSTHWRRELQALAPHARLHVVPNPVEIPFLQDRNWGERPVARIGAENSPPEVRSILFLGRLVPEKGLGELLHAAHHLASQHPHWRWTLAGDGDLESVRQRVRELGLQQQVVLPGHLSDDERRRALGHADLLVLPSWAEGQPLAVLEAMAWAVPVVASRVGGLPDLLNSGAGVLVQPQDPAGLADAIEVTLLDRAGLRRMGEKGRAHVGRHHSPQAVAHQLSALYADLGLRRRAPPSACTASSPQSTQPLRPWGHE
jgi:glycosyltransferase involved in cell wall biosynthesis